MRTMRELIEAATGKTAANPSPIRAAKRARAVKPAGMLYHVAPFSAMEAIRREGLRPFASKPANLPGGDDHAHGPSVFLTTVLPAAFEMLGMLEETKPEDEGYVIAVVDPARLPGRVFFKDPQFDHGVWTGEAIPPTAIVSWMEDPDPDDADEDDMEAYWEGGFRADGSRKDARRG